ncbi:hypothetical protein M2J84_10565 [Comamonas aquatica]|uniref:hypothetical protein n=1 Tax=Comamonas aquatica TaxID=225991 RepID=UPI0022DDA9B7|nr:hypothetical protein [Comamonas aquatica]WBM44005.1 hypothetical protein M2J84_10565 [Comamonas aquatica]
MAGKVQALYLQFGYTTVQDGRADPGGVATAVAAAQQGKFKVDVVSYPDIPPWARAASCRGRITAAATASTSGLAG